MPKTNFNPKGHGFHFENNFTNKICSIPGYGNIETKGRCGGMAYAALDYYFSGLPVPRYTTEDFSPNKVPGDGHWLGDYIYARLMNSFANTSAARFISWSMHSDHETWFFKGVTRWTKEEEFPKLRKEIDAGRPVVLGLIKARSISEVAQNHQVVAYGYDQDGNGTKKVYIYDNNHRDVEVVLTSEQGQANFSASTGEQWRGFFVHSYSRKSPPVEPFQQIFPSVHDYAVRNGYVGAYPNFHSAEYGNGSVYGTILLKNGFAEWRDIYASELGNPVTADDRFRAVNDYAYRNGFRGAFPNFHQADYGNGVVYGCILIKKEGADWRDVSASELGNPGSPEAKFRAINDYAYRNGYRGGFPNFHQANYGNGVVYGSILIKQEAADWRDASYIDL